MKGSTHIWGLGWIVWTWSRSVQIPVHLSLFLARVWAQGIPQQAGLLTVVATPPVLHNSLFSVQDLAAKHTVKGCTCCKNPKTIATIWWREGPAVLPLPNTVVGHDVPLKLGEGEKLFITTAALHQVTLLIELPPVVGSVFYKLHLSLTAASLVLSIVRSDLDLLPMHIQQMHLHVSKGWSDGLAATAFNLQLHWVLAILLIWWLWGVGPGEENKNYSLFLLFFLNKC